MTRTIDRSLAASGLPPLERSAWVEVDIDALVRNARALRSMAAPVAIAPVVKADGYGHGLEMAARCALTGGARWLCVADAAEAFRLRQDGYRGRIFVLYPIPQAVVVKAACNRLDVTVGSTDEARSLWAGTAAPELAVHIEVDTGMTRGGVSPEDAVAAARAIIEGPSTRLAGLWTHLAAPEDSTATERQLRLFDGVLASLAEAGIDPGAVHVSASGGLLAGAVGGHDLARPGLAFYGTHPGAGHALPAGAAPALAVKAHPARIASVAVGTPVGYAGTWIAERNSTIATLPIGYADGWSRSSSPGSRVLVEGRSAPVVGRVSSDSLTVDVTGIAGVGPDSEFTLLGSAGGDEITADEVAATRGTISWEVLQQLGARLARVYTSGPDVVALRPESTVAVTVASEAVIPGYDPNGG